MAETNSVSPSAVNEGGSNARRLEEENSREREKDGVSNDESVVNEGEPGLAAGFKAGRADAGMSSRRLEIWFEVNADPTSQHHGDEDLA